MFCGCHNKRSQNWWLKAAETYSPVVVGARSLKSSCWQGHAPSEASRGASFPTSLASLAGVHVTPVSAPVFKWPCPLSESSLLSLIRTLVIGPGARQRAQDCLFISTSARILFPNKITFMGSDG